jgi:hypothetical protein
MNTTKQYPLLPDTIPEPPEKLRNKAVIIHSRKAVLCLGLKIISLYSLVNSVVKDFNPLTVSDIILHKTRKMSFCFPYNILF